MTVNKKFITLNYNGQLPTSFDNLKCKIQYFPCGEYEFSIYEDVRDVEICLFQTFSVGNFNNELMLLQIVCDVLKRNSAKEINYIAPFLPYTRQDRTYNTTGSLGAKLVAEIVNNCGINQITTYDFHALQIEGFFKGSVHNLSAIPLFLEDINQKFRIQDIVVVFPDAGACSRFKRFFEGTEYEIAIINKARTADGLKMKVLGDVAGRTAIIFDDMIDSGGTIIEAARLLKQQGAKGIYVYSTHGILSGNAVEKLQNVADINGITITNSLERATPLSEKFSVVRLEVI
jgi:ribose-phosphate pyrophosphokinase